MTAQLAESEDAVAQLTTLKAQHQTHIAALELQVAESLEALRSTKAALEANVEQLAGELAAEQKHGLHRLELERLGLDELDGRACVRRR